MTRSTVVIGVALILVAILGIIVFAAPTTGSFTPYAPLPPAALRAWPVAPLERPRPPGTPQPATPAPSQLPTATPAPIVRPGPSPRPGVSRPPRRIVQRLAGVATYQPLPGFYGSAGPVLRAAGVRVGQLVRVCSGVRCVTVRIWPGGCACGLRHGEPTLIDLSELAFVQLAPLGVGVVNVEVSK